MSELSHALEVDDKSIAVDNEGYLLDPTDWSREVANHLASGERLDMCADHWAVVNFVRDYYEQNQSVSEARRVLKALGEQLGKDKATRKFLDSLFPYGYGQQACKIAGMRKPLKLMLDL